MIMTIDSEKIMDRVNGQLAKIGKMRTDVSFADLLVSSGQVSVVDEFVREALVNVVSKGMGAFGGLSADSGYVHSITSKKEGLEAFLESYIINYCIWSFVCMYDLVNLVQSYSVKVDASFTALLFHAMDKEVPGVGVKLSETSGSCV